MSKISQIKSTFFTLLIISISCFITSSNSQTIIFNYVICSDPANTTESDNFKSNLSNNLNTISSKLTSSNTFYNETSDGIYSLYLCRGDISLSTCQLCVNQAINTIQDSCGTNKTAVIWYDQCLLRYSKENFLGVAQTSPYVMMYNTGNNNVTRGQTNTDALGLIYTLINRAPYTESMFEIQNGTVYSDGSKQYGLVQCSRDINSSECTACLKTLSERGQSCCQYQRGWRILAPSCIMRYEDYLFYELPSTPPTVVPAAPEPVPSNNGTNKNITIVIVTTSLATLAALLGFLYWFFYHKKRKQIKELGESSQVILLSNAANGNQLHQMEIAEQVIDHDNNGEVQCFNLIIIKEATKNFSDENKLGEGGFGPVYKGKLPNGQEIAVKRLSLTSKQGLEEFRNEVMVIIKLQHKNLVRLLGYCLDGDEKLLVYEYLANTSLDAFLFDPKKCKELDWKRRENIITGTARGLMYLHEDSRLKIIHRDLKASNILLDDDLNPKISDFGTARIFGGNQIEANTDRVVGTFGYMAPEYALEGLISIKSDVYSFGVLMLEIISGKKNRGFYNPEHGQSLLLHAWELWSEGKGEELIDKIIIDDCPRSKVLRWIHIALLCVQDDPADRPMMSLVVLMLGSKSVNLPQLAKAPHSVIRFTTISDISTTSGAGSSMLLSDQSTANNSR